MKLKNLGVGCFLVICGGAGGQNFSNPVSGYEELVAANESIIGELYVGSDSASNTLHMLSGSYVENSTGYIGFLNNANGNAVLVDDSEWNNRLNLRIGLLGRENQLTIQNGGIVSAENSYVSLSSSSTSNAVHVASGGRWYTARNLEFGSYGSANRLTIDDGEVVAGTVFVGRFARSFDNKVSLNGGLLEADSNFIIGGLGSSNRVTVTAGDVVSGQNLVIGERSSAFGNLFEISGSNSTVQAAGFYVGKDGQSNRFAADDGVQISVSDHFIVGSGESAENNHASIYGEGTVFTAGELTVGDEGDRNQLRFYEGAHGFVSGNAFVGRGSNSVGNLITVDGSDSMLDIDGDLHVGAEGRYNRMIVRRGAQLESENAFIGSGLNARFNRVDISSGSSWANTGHLGLANRSTLLIGSGATVSTDTYTQDGSSTLVYGFDADEGVAGVGLLNVENAAVFEEGALIDFQAPLSQLNIGDAYTLLSAQQIIGGTLTNDVSQILPEQLLLDVNVVEADGRASLEYIRKSLVDVTASAGLTIEDLLHSIDAIAVSNQQAEILLQTINRSGMTGEEAAEKLDQQYSRRVEVVRVIEQARISALGQVSTHMRMIQERKYAEPILGPLGPHKAGQGWAPWFEGYGAKGRASEKEDFKSYDARTYGGMFGFDRSVGALLGGVAVGYSDSAIDQDDGDESDINTYYGYVYGSAGVRRWYTDFSLGYARSEMDVKSGAGLGTSSSFGADDYMAYIAVGRQARNEQWLLTPQLAWIGSYYMQEAHTESGPMAPDTHVDAYDRWSLRYSIGAALAYEKHYKNVIVKPEIRAYWLHEFNADEDTIDYRFDGGGGGHAYRVRSPDEDVLELGAGLEFLFADRLKLTFDFDAEMSDFYRGYSASGRLAYEF